MAFNNRQRVHFGPRPMISDRSWRILGAIADRAAALFPDRKRADIFLDISCVHAGPCKLRLDEFLAADDLNFCHDILGIERHLDRHTMELKDCFCPRFADRQVAT